MAQNAAVPGSAKADNTLSEHRISINDIDLVVGKGGSKLRRVSSETYNPHMDCSWTQLLSPDDPSVAVKTPKEAIVNGVLFKISKN